MDFVLIIISSIALGVFVGVSSGLLGIGGGTIMVPIFRMLFGMSPLESTATSLFTIIPTSISGAISHIRHKTALVKLGFVLGIAGACTSPLGVILAGISPGWLVMIVTALVIGYSAINMFRKALKLKPRQKESASEVTPRETPSDKTINELSATEKNADQDVLDNSKKGLVRFDLRTVFIAIVLGLAVGCISGYVGVGGGFIMVPFMVFFFGLPLKKASGTSLVAIIILAIPAVIQQGMLGNVDYLAGLVVTIGSIPGAIFGAKFAQLVPERTLRFIFGGFLIVAAVLLALNEFHVLG